jgi:hypothetical protein
MMNITKKQLMLMALLVAPTVIIVCQCASAANIYTFVYNGKSYEVIRENKTWVEIDFSN